MAQRDTRHNHAKTRQASQERDESRGQKNDLLAERAPLAGYEGQYEISRQGRVFSLQTRAVTIGGYHHSPFIRITVNGTVVTLNKEKAVSDSFKAKAAAVSRTGADGGP